MSPKRHAGRMPVRRWTGFDDAQLLDCRFRELRLGLAGSALARDVHDLYLALEHRGIRFRPHVWLSTEWFSPDGIPGIAIPFYLAHPRLTRLERRMKGDAEGSTRTSRRQLLRHEAGHALDTAFGLRRRADWRATFGRASSPYPRWYTARPASHRYVQHLSHWYAQSHPTEDFAETFAVWLQPRARWRREYAGWRALRKLEFVDRLMAEIAGKRPAAVDRAKPANVNQNRRRIGEHYRRSPASLSHGERRYDAWLYRAFAARESVPGAPRADTFLRSIAADLRTYLASHVIGTIRRRTRELDLVLDCGRREARRRARQLHQQVVADILERNRERFAL